MRRFVLSMLLGVGLATLMAVGLARTLLPAALWEGAARPERPANGAFGQQDAIDVVGTRLGTSPTAWQLRRSLQTRGRVEYHSPNHWTVRLGEASWTAHGDGGPSPGGRYAEPDNDAAKALEAEVTGR